MQRHGGWGLVLLLLLGLLVTDADHLARVTYPADGVSVAGPEVEIRLELHRDAVSLSSGQPDELLLCIAYRAVADWEDEHAVAQAEAWFHEPMDTGDPRIQCFEVVLESSATANPIQETELFITFATEGWHLLRVLLHRVTGPTNRQLLSVHGVNIFIAMQQGPDWSCLTQGVAGNTNSARAQVNPTGTLLADGGACIWQSTAMSEKNASTGHARSKS